MWCVDANWISPEEPQFWCDPDNPVNCTPPNRLMQGQGGRGMNWAWGAMVMTGMHTIRPPNSEMCEAHWYDNVGTCPPSSRHQGGVHVLMGDGAVIFLTDSIEAGNQRDPVIGARLPGDVKNRPGKKSPYGLWGALGSRGAKETIEEQLNQ